MKKFAFSHFAGTVPMITRLGSPASCNANITDSIMVRGFLLFFCHYYGNRQHCLIDGPKAYSGMSLILIPSLAPASEVLIAKGGENSF